MKRSERKLWAAATTLPQLGELTAQWLEGRIPSQPHYVPNCGPDPETERLIPVLARVNRAGYLTDCSQPGMLPARGCDGRLWRQRAGVQGFADDRAMAELKAAAGNAGLLVIALRSSGVAADRYHGGVCVTGATDGFEHTWFGCGESVSGIRSMYWEVSETAQRALIAAWQVSLVDPEWGRDDLLWTVLDRWAMSRTGAAR